MKMGKHIITDEEIEKITKLLYRNSNLSVIKILKELPGIPETTEGVKSPMEIEE